MSMAKKDKLLPYPRSKINSKSCPIATPTLKERKREREILALYRHDYILFSNNIDLLKHTKNFLSHNLK